MPDNANRWKSIVLLGLAALIVLYLTGRYLTTPEARLFALDAETGRVQWSNSLGDDRTGEPTVVNGRVFVDISSYNDDPDKFWELDAFDADTGVRLWTFMGPGVEWAEDTFVTSSRPVAVDDLVVDDLDDDTLGVFDAATGTLLQTIDDVSLHLNYTDDNLPMVLTGGRLIALQQKEADGSWTNSLLSLEATTGSLVWRTECSDLCEGQEMISPQIDPPILVDGQSVFIRAVEQVDVYALDSGRYQFSLDLDCNDIELVGTILYCQDSSFVIAMEVTTGEILWEFRVPDTDQRSLLIGMQTDDQVLYVRKVQDSTPTGITLLALDPLDGQMRWQKQLMDQSSDIANLWFVRSSQNSGLSFEMSILDDQARLVALSVADGSTQWQFPVWEGFHLPACAAGQVFVIDRAPRWRNWLAHLNPAWH